MLQSVVAEYLVEGRDLPLLQHGAAAVLLEPTNEHAADARLNGNHASVVEQVSRAGVRQWLVQLELAALRLQITDRLVLGPTGFVVWNAATTLAQAADANEHGGALLAVRKYSLAGLVRPV